MRRVTLRVAAILAVSVLGAAVVLAVPSSSGRASAQTEPSAPVEPAAPAEPTGPTLDQISQAVELTTALMQGTARLSAVDRELADVGTRLTTVAATIQDLDRQYGIAQGERQRALDRLRGRAAESYQQGGAPLDPVLDIDRLESLSTVTKYANAAAVVDSGEVERLEARIAALADQRNAAFTEQQELTARSTQLTTERVQLSDQLAFRQALLAQLGGVPVMGESQLGADQMVAWFQSTGQDANLPEGTTIADLVQMYVEEGAAEHVRADLAFAQSVLETGSFRETRGNNYAGIGNCDSCGGRGIFFPTPRDGVRAQIQLLRNYADPGSRAANLAHPPEPTLYGTDPVAAASSYDSFFLKGKVPLWNQMGNGNWATSTTYATNVLRTYSRMLDFADSRSG